MQNDKVNHSVIFFVPSLAIGGAEKVMVRLANGLVKKGIDCYFISFFDGSMKSEIDDNIPVSILSNKLKFSVVSFIKSLIKLILVVRSIHPNSIVSTVTGANLVLCAFKFFLPKKTRVIIREATTLQNYSKIKFFLALLLYRNADTAICVSNVVKKGLKNHRIVSEKQLRVIYNPASIPIKRQKKEMNKVDGPFIFLSVGRLVHVKGLDVLINAFLKFQEKTQGKGKLYIVGDGPERHSLEKILEGQLYKMDVNFVGMSPTPEEYYELADCYVMASRWEGFPNALLDAISYQLPIISSDCDAALEILNKNQENRIFPMNDSCTLAREMLEVYEKRVNFKPGEIPSLFNMSEILEQYCEELIPRY